MGFKINVDRFGFAKEPKPEKNSRDYAAQLAKKLVDKEVIDRTNEDAVLLGKITEESDARRADKAELQLEIDDKVTGEKVERNDAIRDAIDEEVTARNNAIESAIAQEERARELKDNALEELIDEKVSVKADKGITLEAYGIVNAYTIPEVNEIKEGLETEIGKKVDNQTNDGFMAGGAIATSTWGVTIGAGAKSEEFSLAIGAGSYSHASGISLGIGAVSAENGVAIGATARSDGGVAIGNDAYIVGENINAIQIGTGENTEDKTFQVYDFKLLNADGTIPEERIPKLAVHEADIEALKQSGGGNVDLSDYYTKGDIDDMYGDINSALDEIEALQDNLIGGGNA